MDRPTAQDSGADSQSALPGFSEKAEAPAFPVKSPAEFFLLIAGELLQSYREGDDGSSDASQKLTVRQREVLQLVAEGSSAKEVAAALSISVRTAEAHEAHILEALELRSTAELVQYAIRSGIISLD